MIDVLYVCVLGALVAAAAFLAARAQGWRDPRWVGVLVVTAVAAVIAAWSGSVSYAG